MLNGLLHAVALETAGGRITSIYAMRNPEKLRTLHAHFMTS
ncbi:MAG TPA: hypothetical protein VIG32_10060 [Candidatus Baltobacteraceae bacterium]|jgi:hypothetical protein